LESREYNSRWYTDVKAWKVSRDGDRADNSQSYGSQYNETSNTAGITALDNDDIPF